MPPKPTTPPIQTIYNMTPLSPCLRRTYSSSRQSRPALMLARRAQRGPRPSSPRMTPDLASTRHASLPPRSSATTERTMNTRGAPKTNHAAPSSPSATRSAESLGRQFRSTAHLARDRGGFHRVFEHSLGLAVMSKPVLPRFVNITSRACCWALEHDGGGNNWRTAPFWGGTRVTIVRATSPRS